MSLLYKDNPITKVDIAQSKGLVDLTFYSDCGKFGTEELLDVFHLTPDELLKILQKDEGQ